MAKGSIATYAAFEESAFFPAILGELLMLKSFAVYRADRSVKRVVKKVAGLVAHRLDMGVQIGLLVLQEVPVGLVDAEAGGLPGHRVHLLLHVHPVLDAGVLVKAACDDLPETNFENSSKYRVFVLTGTPQFQ